MAEPTTAVVCEGTCTVVVQLDASMAIAQVQAAIPTFEELLPIFTAAVLLWVTAWSMKQLRKVLD